MTRAEGLQGLKDIVTFLEEHPGVPCPTYTTLNAHVDNRADIVSIARMASWEKNFCEDYFSLRKRFDGGIILDVFTDRSTVCRKVVTGTKMLPAQPEREEETYEWVCDEPLLQGAK